LGQATAISSAEDSDSAVAAEAIVEEVLKHFLRFRNWVETMEYQMQQD